MVTITAKQQKRGLPLYFTAADSIRVLEVALIAGSVLDVSTTEVRCGSGNLSNNRSTSLDHQAVSTGGERLSNDLAPPVGGTHLVIGSLTI